MRAARLHGAGDVRLHDEAEPDDAPEGHSVVQVVSVGLCGSDLHWFAEGGIGDATIAHPIVPGHEFGAVALTGPFAGRRVAVDPAIPCDHCEMCGRGWHNLCPTVRFAGHGELDGGMQQRMVWPDAQLFPVPDAIGDDGIALLEPLGVAIHTVDLSHVHLGDDALVVGAGPIGLLLVPLLRRAGAGRVIAVEPRDHRRAAAERAGADAVFDPTEALAGIDRFTGGRGVDVAVEIAGTDAAIATAVDAVRPGARVVLAGIPSGDRSSFGASAARRKGLTFAMVRRMNDVYPRAIALAAAGVVDLDALVTDRFPLADAATAFASAEKRGGLKTVVRVAD